MLLMAASYLMWMSYLSEQLPVLDNEMFHSVKPGLSAYADSPETVSSLSSIINYIDLREKVSLLYIVVRNAANSLPL